METSFASCPFRAKTVPQADQEKEGARFLHDS
jgi:hypothetical protein